jgi:hypothetical protein
MCDCLEEPYHGNEYEEEEETIRPPLPPWDRDYLLERTNWELPVDADTESQPVDDDYLPIHSEITWSNYPADVKTETQLDAWNTSELADQAAAYDLPEEEEGVNAGTIKDDGPVFGPLDEAAWKRIDRVKEIENHHTLDHGRPGYKWNSMGGPGQCEYCQDNMWRYLLRCPDCGLGLCRMCSRGK